MEQKAADLSREFGSVREVTFIEDPDLGWKALVTSPEAGSLEVFGHGATISSWRHPKFEQPVLFVSTKAEFKRGKPIRGGIPLVFPQFGGGPLPSHGLVRTAPWSLVSVESRSGLVSLTLEFTTTDPAWAGSARCRYTITVGNSLDTVFEVENTGQSHFDFQLALHSYFKVGDIAKTYVQGLKNLDFLDNLNDRAPGHDDSEQILIDREIDRVYLDSPSPVLVEDRELNRVIVIEKDGLPDSVLWNPWIEKSKRLADLGDADYLGFVCVESGLIAEPRGLAAGESFRGSQRLSVK